MRSSLLRDTRDTLPKRGLFHSVAIVMCLLIRKLICCSFSDLLYGVGRRQQEACKRAETLREQLQKNNKMRSCGWRCKTAYTYRHFDHTVSRCTSVAS